MGGGILLPLTLRKEVSKKGSQPGHKSGIHEQHFDVKKSEEEHHFYVKGEEEHHFVKKSGTSTLMVPINKTIWRFCE